MFLSLISIPKNALKAKSKTKDGAVLSHNQSCNPSLFHSQIFRLCWWSSNVYFNSFLSYLHYILFQFYFNLFLSYFYSTSFLFYYYFLFTFQKNLIIFFILFLFDLSYLSLFCFCFLFSISILFYFYFSFISFV